MFVDCGRFRKRRIIELDSVTKQTNKQNKAKQERNLLGFPSILFLPLFPSKTQKNLIRSSPFVAKRANNVLVPKHEIAFDVLYLNIFRQNVISTGQINLRLTKTLL